MIDAAIERGQFVIYVAYVLIGFAAFLVARMLFQEEESRAAQENLQELRDRKASNFLVRITRPMFTQYIVPMLRGKPTWDNKRKIYKRKIISAGLRDELTSDEFIAFKFFLILFFPLVGGFLKAGEFIDITWITVLITGVVGWFYPDVWVNGRIKKRQEQIRRAMPFIVDLLALSTEAGLDFIGAMARVVEKAKSSPLVDEFSQVLKEIKVGSSRGEALRELATRVNMPEINSFIAILISADQMGASIGRVLRQQSEQLRTERMLRAEKAGAQAVTKLLAPTGIILIAVMLLIFAPVGLSFFYGTGQ